LDAWAGYIRNLEKFVIPELRASLEPLESRKMRTGKRCSDGPWIDTTKENIRMLKQAIIQYEAILAMLHDGETPQSLPKSALRH
jgi:hypothetical protein